MLHVLRRGIIYLTDDLRWSGWLGVFRGFGAVSVFIGHRDPVPIGGVLPIPSFAPSELSAKGVIRSGAGLQRGDDILRSNSNHGQFSCAKQYALRLVPGLVTGNNRREQSNLMTFIKATFTLVSLFILATVFALGQDLPDGPGKDFVSKTCSTCHSTDYFTTKRQTRDEWKAVVDTMISYGAQITDEQSVIVVNYLVKNFGKDAVSAKGPVPARQR
jgi:hypothetical protein